MPKRRYFLFVNMKRKYVQHYLIAALQIFGVWGKAETGIEPQNRNRYLLI